MGSISRVPEFRYHPESIGRLEVVIWRGICFRKTKVFEESQLINVRHFFNVLLRGKL